MRILAIDQGTTGTTAVLIDEQGALLAKAYRELHQWYPQPGWVEHEPEDIWHTVCETIEDVLEQSPGAVDTVGITNQRETTILWDRTTGAPLHRAIVWQCRRTATICNTFRFAAASILRKTGLPLDAYFSATKLRWLLDNVPGAPDTWAFGTVDAWLIWKLTGGAVHATDPTNASRTLLYNIADRCWDPDLLALFGIPAHLLPEVRPSVGDFGVVSTIPALAGVPINGVAGDQQAALFGQTCFEAGEAKNTYGTGCFLVMNTGDRLVRSEHLAATLAVDGSGRTCFALEGSIFVAGAAIQWLRDELGIIATASESESLAASVGDNGGVYFIPAFVGLGAPHWDMRARGTITGLTRGSGRAHLVRAALESMAFQSWDVLVEMEDVSGFAIDRLMVDGGAAANSFLMQFQADIAGRPVARPRLIESTALGSAMMAGMAKGIWRTADELRTLKTIEHTFMPRMSDVERGDLLQGWRRALHQTLEHGRV